MKGGAIRAIFTEIRANLVQMRNSLALLESAAAGYEDYESSMRCGERRAAISTARSNSAARTLLV